MLPVPYNIIKRLTLEERNELMDYIHLVTNTPLPAHEEQEQHQNPTTDESLLQVAFTAFMCVAFVLSLVIIVNCIK